MKHAFEQAFAKLQEKQRAKEKGQADQSTGGPVREGNLSVHRRQRDIPGGNLKDVRRVNKLHEGMADRENS